MTSHFDLEYARKLHVLMDESLETQEMLGEYLGIGQQVVSDLLNGKKHFSDEIIKKICTHYDVKTEAFKEIQCTPELHIFFESLQHGPYCKHQIITESAKEIKRRELVYSKRMKKLELENLELTIENNRSKDASNRLKKKIKAEVRVMV